MSCELQVSAVREPWEHVADQASAPLHNAAVPAHTGRQPQEIARLQQLDAVGYRCYWQGGDVPWLKGRLALANGAGWCESFGFPMWSNLVCTHLDWAARLLDGLTETPA